MLMTAVRSHSYQL